MGGWIERVADWSEDRIRKQAHKQAFKIAKSNCLAFAKFRRSNPQIGPRELLMRTVKSRYAVLPISSDAQAEMLRGTTTLRDLLYKMIRTELASVLARGDTKQLALALQGIESGIDAAIRRYAPEEA